MSLTVQGNFTERFEGNMISHTEKERQFHSQNMEISSEVDINVNSNKTFKRNSGERTIDF